MAEEDYLMKLIKSGVNMAVALFSGKDAVKSAIEVENNNLTLSEDDLLEYTIRKYINEGKINEAENSLFEAIESRKNKRILETALFFYNEIGKWDDNKLMSHNFSKDEVEQGLKDIKNLYEKAI